jgi:hypothetical protein
MLHLADAHGVGVLLAERNMAPQSRCAQIRMIGGLLTLGHAENSALPKAHGYAGQRIDMHGSRDRQLNLHQDCVAPGG